jgi:hypothetical protein
MRYPFIIIILVFKQMILSMQTRIWGLKSHWLKTVSDSISIDPFHGNGIKVEK